MAGGKRENAGRPPKYLRQVASSMRDQAINDPKKLKKSVALFEGVIDRAMKCISRMDTDDGARETVKLGLDAARYLTDQQIGKSAQSIDHTNAGEKFETFVIECPRFVVPGDHGEQV